MPEEEEDYHTCHFCGEYVKKGLNPKGERHWLSDCRPDLVEHEPGETCTWWGMESHRLFDQPDKFNCYAYQDFGTREWTNEHTHFHKDGPM